MLVEVYGGGAMEDAVRFFDQRFYVFRTNSGVGGLAIARYYRDLVSEIGVDLT